MSLNRAVMIGVIFLVTWFVTESLVARDDTDPPGGRSGMALYTDNRTGCQYLRGGYFSSLTPRMNEYGEHVCKEIPR